MPPGAPVGGAVAQTHAPSPAGISGQATAVREQVEDQGIVRTQALNFALRRLAAIGDPGDEADYFRNGYSHAATALSGRPYSLLAMTSPSAIFSSSPRPARTRATSPRGRFGQNAVPPRDPDRLSVIGAVSKTGATSFRPVSLQQRANMSPDRAGGQTSKWSSLKT